MNAFAAALDEEQLRGHGWRRPRRMRAKAMARARGLATGMGKPGKLPRGREPPRGI
jgi:hypothetical protein